MSLAALQRLASRTRLMVGRAVLALVNDAAGLQAVQVQVQAGVVRDNAEHFQHYGFTSVPLPGAEGIALAVGGSTDHLVVLCIDDRRYRLTGLQPGESAQYDSLGNCIIIKGGEITVKHGTQVTIDAPLVALTGSLTVAGNVTAAGTVTAPSVVGGGKSLAGHVHSGVTVGAGNTGGPV